LYEMLEAIHLDVVYHRGEADFLWYRKADGSEVRVLDLVGGFGASLLGHNHPEIRERAGQILAEGRPNHAQASVGVLAGQLAERLAHAIRSATGREYVGTLANSGAEAVEAAIKHAEMERDRRVQKTLAELRRTFRLVRLGMREGRVRLHSA